jgi:manganese/zinc/iron transport system permease protein
MTLVSVTAVSAFDVAGSILIVGLMIGPPATAYLLTDRLSRLLLTSVVIGVVTAVAGCWVASELEARSYAGAIAAVQGVVFGLAWVLAPQYGLIAAGLRRLRQRWEFAQAMLAIHLFNHEGLPEAERESELAHLHEHLQWRPDFVRQVVRLALREELVEERNGVLHLTEAGRQLARQMIVK